VLLRLFLIVLLAWILIATLRAYLFGRKRSVRRPNSASLQAEEMVFDPQCQSYIPKGEALFQKGNYFCSQKCAALHLTR
jgi:uncharacterized protein